MMQLDHINIVKIEGICIDQVYYYIIMELVQGKMFTNYIKNGISQYQLASIVKQILSALNYAHQMKITHRDLKPENIIVSDHRTVLLDYGLSKNKD